MAHTIDSLQSHITFELYERNHGRGKSDKEYSIKISLSEGAHSSNVLDSTLDARHSLNVMPKRYSESPSIAHVDSDGLA